MSTDSKHEVLQLSFEAESTEILLETWKKLEEKLGRSIRNTLGWPHISLTSSTGSSIAGKKESLSKVYQSIKIPHVTLSHIGIFRGTTSVVFIALTPTPALLSLNEKLCSTIEAPGVIQCPYYQPGLFLPHCSMATGVSEKELGLVLEELSPKLLGQKIPIRSLELVEYFPPRRVFEAL